MKKFCSTCGNQLELSQRFCGGCGAVNPFFVPAFTLLAEQKESLEKLRIEKERIETEKARIEKELAEIELAQQEVERQEQLRREVEELDRQKAERIEQERLLREQAEREKIEANLKKEIQRVKEEAEQHKNETIDLVRKVRREVKEEINQIEEENKKLKQEMHLLSRQIPERVEQAVNPTPAPPVSYQQPEIPEATTPVEYETADSNNGFIKIALAATVLLIVGVAVFFAFMHTGSTSKQTAATTEPHSSTAVISGNKVVDTVLSDETPPVKDTIARQQASLTVTPAVLTTTTPPALAKNTASSATSTPKSKSDNALTVARVRNDLTGRKILGCGITINSATEMESVSNIVLIERTSKYTRYKCEVQIKQGNDSYTAHPYLYYNTDGSFMKLDGTSCE